MKRHQQSLVETRLGPSAKHTKDITVRQRTKLTNMHRLRRQAILRRMATDMSFSAAEKNTQHVFDTVGWEEVLSRLYRARGIVFGIGGLLAGRGRRLRDAEFVDGIRDLAKLIDTAATGLSITLPDIVPQPNRRTDQEVKRKTSQPYATVQRITSTFVIAQLRVARAFIAKCLRDAPYIEARGGPALTGEQRGVIEREIRRIQVGVSRLKAAVRGSGLLR